MAVIIILLSCAVVQLPVISAHAPSDMTLEYDIDSQILTVTLVHSVSNPQSHYVYRIEIEKNGVVYTSEEFVGQPTDSEFIYTFSVPATDRDVLKLTAECNLGGSIQATLEVESGRAQVEVPELWPIHAVFMTGGLLLMLGAVVNVLKKTPKAWFKTHKATGGLAVVCVLIGLTTGMHMVSVSGGSHFRVLHAYVGVVTLLFSVATPLIGVVSSKWTGHRPQMRNVHIWFGRCAVILIIVTIVLGLIQAGVI